MYPVLNESEARGRFSASKTKTAGMERDAHHSKPAVKFCPGEGEISHFTENEDKGFTNSLMR